MKKKILIIRLTSFGDVVLTTHLPRLIKAQHPDFIIDYVTIKPYSELLRNNICIDNIFVYHKADGKIYDKNGEKIDLLQKQYSAVFDLQRNKYSKKISKDCNTTIHSIQKNNWKKFLLVHFKINLLRNIITVPEKYLNTFQALNLKNDESGLELWLQEDLDKLQYNSINHSDNSKIIAIAPGAKHFTKRYPPEKFVALMTMLKQNTDYAFLLLGSNDEIETCNQIEQSLSFSVDNRAGKTSITESIELIDKSKLLICNDSALMHVAAARNTPVVAIFGSTVEEFGFFPYRSSSFIIQKDIPCRPCTHIGRKKCPKKHFRCLNDIEVGDFEFLLNIKKAIL